MVGLDRPVGRGGNPCRTSNGGMDTDKLELAVFDNEVWGSAVTLFEGHAISTLFEGRNVGGIGTRNGKDRCGGRSGFVRAEIDTKRDRLLTEEAKLIEERRDCTWIKWGDFCWIDSEFRETLVNFDNLNVASLAYEPCDHDGNREVELIVEEDGIAHYNLIVLCSHYQFVTNGRNQLSDRCTDYASDEAVIILSEEKTFATTRGGEGEVAGGSAFDNHRYLFY